MIFTRDGRPIDAEFWLDFKLAMTARLHARATKGRRFYLTNPDGTRCYRVVKDKLGTPIPIYRDTTYYQPSRYAGIAYA